MADWQLKCFSTSCSRFDSEFPKFSGVILSLVSLNVDQIHPK